MKKWVAVMAILVFGTRNAAAFLGVGDVTFDPPVHAELISLFNETLTIYHGVLSEINRIQSVEMTLRNAQRDVKAITNGSLIRYETSQLPVGIPRSLGRTVAGASDAAHVINHVGGYYQQQVRRFERLARLKWLARSANQNVTRSAQRLGVRSSDEVTAQATASLAAMASRRARASASRAVRKAAERRNQKNLPQRAASLYRAFGQRS